MTKQTDTRVGEHDNPQVRGERQGPGHGTQRDPAQRERQGTPQHEGRKQHKQGR